MPVAATKTAARTGGEIFQLADSGDAVQDMLAKIGDLGKVSLAGARVLMWIYVAPRKVGNILMPDSVVLEDKWQGTVGYVLKTGPRAFKNDEQNDFAGFAAAAGDWVLFTPGEGRRVQINGIDCRIIEDALIQARIADPTIITHRQ